MAKRKASGSFRAHWRFNLFLLLVAAGAAIGTPVLGWARGFTVGFDIAALVFLGSAVQLMRGKTPTAMRKQAALVDAGRFELLAVTIVILGVVLTALVVELMGSRSEPFGAALAIVTLVLAWGFTTTVYALHYAHLFYTSDAGKDAAGLEFPGGEEPDYWDFVYFAVVLGSTFQVSDVEISSRTIRRVATVHGLVAFFFNIGVVTLTINIIGSAL